MMCIAKRTAEIPATKKSDEKVRLFNFQHTKEFIQERRRMGKEKIYKWRKKLKSCFIIRFAVLPVRASTPPPVTSNSPFFMNSSLQKFVYSTHTKPSDLITAS